MTTPNSTDSAAATVYVLEPGLSRFTAKAVATGLFAAFGHSPLFAIRQFAGEVKFAPDASEQTALRVVAQATSLELLDKMSDKDRREIENTMRNDVLETSRFPEIVFEASSPSISKAGDGIYGANLQGRLTLHGVTQPQQVSTQVSVNQAQLRAFGEFTVRQTSFGIKLVSAAAGTLKVKDDVKISFDLVARKQEIKPGAGKEGP